LVQKTSSLDLYPICKNNGWELRILDSLHAKVYATPRQEMWIGSANLTGNGMGISHMPNKEVMVQIENPTEDDWVSIDSLLQLGVVVNDRLYGAYCDWLSRQPEFLFPKLEKFHPPEDDILYSLETLPHTFRPIELYETLRNPNLASKRQINDARHDLALLGIKFDLDQNIFSSSLQHKFFEIPLVSHMILQIDEEWTRFGKMRKMLSKACGGYENVNHDNVTKQTQNFYEWVEELDDSEEFEFGVPRHSQLIRRKPEGHIK
jgi:hypothetical protein